MIAWARLGRVQPNRGVLGSRMSRIGSPANGCFYLILPEDCLRKWLDGDFISTVFRLSHEVRRMCDRVIGPFFSLVYAPAVADSFLHALEFQLMEVVFVFIVLVPFGLVPVFSMLKSLYLFLKNI